MLVRYAYRNDRLEPMGSGDTTRSVWVDLREPSEDEAKRVEEATGLSLPSREDMQEIEISSRLYEENGARFMTITALAGLDTDSPRRSPVTFILNETTLVTLRHDELKTFAIFAKRAARGAVGSCETGSHVMLGLLETLVDRLADAMERVGDEIDTLSHAVFRGRGRTKDKSRDLEALIGRIGRQGELIDMMQESLVSLRRVGTYLSAIRTGEADSRQRVKMIQRDTTSLSEHGLFLSDKVTFLLDAALGLITLEQNKVIKIFSIVSVVFMPPTLVASVYGMNFDVMPELHWPLGYPFALLLMVLFAALPFLVFKRKGWL